MPNEMRLSCGALMKDSFHKSTRAVSVKRLLGSYGTNFEVCGRGIEPRESRSGARLFNGSRTHIAPAYGSGPHPHTYFS